MIICIAGKNRIAVEVTQFMVQRYGKASIVACPNSTDDGINGWQPSFKLFCIQNEIHIVDIEELYETENLLLISLEYNKIISPKKFKTKRLFNIHFSKLPSYKGMYTSIMPLLHGETVGGVTMHCIDKGIDTGDIIDQVVFDIPLDYTARDMYDVYLETGYKLFIKNAENLLNNSYTAYPQPFLQSTYFSRAAVNLSDIVIDLKKTAFDIHNQIRAYIFRDYQLPQVYGHSIYKSEIVFVKSTGKTGSIAHQDEWTMYINAIDYQVKMYIDKQDVLNEAAAKGDIAFYKRLTENNYPVRVRTQLGWDALIIACYHNQTEFVVTLLQDGWDVDSCNYKGTSALMYAMTTASKIDRIDILVEMQKFNPNWQWKDDTGKNIFEYAQLYGNQQVINYIKQFNQ